MPEALTAQWRNELAQLGRHRRRLLRQYRSALGQARERIRAELRICEIDMGLWQGRLNEDEIR